MNLVTPCQICAIRANLGVLLPDASVAAATPFGDARLRHTIEASAYRIANLQSRLLQADDIERQAVENVVSVNLRRQKRQVTFAVKMNHAVSALDFPQEVGDQPIHF